ncbi:MAG TPA: S1C family serine protease [Terriglobia bacterium]
MQEPFGSTWRALSDESASAIGKVGPAVVAVHARGRIPSSGVHWKPGIVVTADHSVERDEEITLTLPDGRTAAATLAGRDPSTDLAILKLDGVNLPLPETGDISTLKVGHAVLAAGRTAEGGSRASLAMIGVVGPAWRTWRGGVLDPVVRLDRNLHPNFSGGAVVNHQGCVLGIATSGLSRYGAVVIPAATVERVTAELEKRGHVGRGFLGVGMAPVRIPRKLRESLKLAHHTGIVILGVEPDSPAEKAGLILGDVLLALDSSPVRDTDDIQTFLTGDRIGQAVKASIIRGGSAAEVVVTVGERPVAK